MIVNFNFKQILIFILFFNYGLFAEYNAIFIPDNLDTNVIFLNNSFADKDELFNNAILYVKKCLNLLDVDYKDFPFDKRDVLFSKNGTILSVLVKGEFFAFYQEGCNRFCGRRALFRDLSKYENIFVFENDEKFKKSGYYKGVFEQSRFYYESFDISDQLRPGQGVLNKIIFCSLGIKHVIFLPKEYDSDFIYYKDGKPQLNIEYTLKEIDVKKAPMSRMMFSIMPGGFNSSSDDVQTSNLTFLDYLFEKEELIKVLPEFKVYKEGGRYESGRHRLILDLKQQPYYFYLYSFEDKDVFSRKIPWFSGIDLSFFKQAVFFNKKASINSTFNGGFF